MTKKTKNKDALKIGDKLIIAPLSDEIIRFFDKGSDVANFYNINIPKEDVEGDYIITVEITKIEQKQMVQSYKNIEKVEKNKVEEDYIF